MDKDFSLEKNIDQIRQIVEKMQKGVSDFDQQVALFTEGTELIKNCQTYLDKAEFTIKQLVEGKLEDFSLESDGD